MNQAVLWQFLVFTVLLAALAKPLGGYLQQVLSPCGRTMLTPLFGRLERWIYRRLGVAPEHEQNWRQYAWSLGVFSLGGFFFTYIILRCQHLLPINPQHLPALSPHLAFNTAVSFLTNTNWQSYAGELALSHFSQMVGLTFHNFVSAAAGIAVAAALVRGIARQSSRTIGHFWVDMVRVTLYVLLPLSFLFAIFLVSQGVIQNFQADRPFRPLEAPTGQAALYRLPQGPVASQEAIKMVGTNGGGFFNANSAHPYENPTPLSNFLQMLAIFLIPAGLTHYLGRATGSRRHGWAVWSAMAVLFAVSFLVCLYAESAGNPRLHALGTGGGGNMEGKEWRNGIGGSTLYAVVTTDASCGAVNAMHDSFTPLGGIVLLTNMMLGEVVFGGVGAGLYGMLIFVLLAVFLAGLMVGRTPEYLGKKITAHDVKLCVFVVLVTAVSILVPGAWAASTRWGTATLGNGGPHGFSEILYAFTSAAANNGSAFAGLGSDTMPYNTMLGVVMLIGRFLVIVPVLALAGHMAEKKRLPAGSGSFPVHGATFVLLLIGTIVIVGLLTFLPALSLGPLLEHFLMTRSGRLF